ncbi:MAG TPA: DUF3108 domain-containing protein [Paraburkholderia sp.]|nr:DUF3108 domain-containing protein [Paraburkholderia sp.]
MSSTVTNRRASRTASSGSRRARASRWVAAFVAVTALHWLAAQWFVRHRDIAQPAPPTHVPVQIALLKPQQIERVAPPAAAAHAPATHAPATPKPHAAPPHTLTAIARAPRPKVAAPPAAPAQPASSAAAEPASAPAAEPASSPAAASAPVGAQAAQASGSGDHPSAQPGPASHGTKFSVPPSADLSYDTFYNGVRNQPGTIHWASDGQHYEMIVSVPLPFIGTFSWASRGHVDAFGLAPDQYAEKRGHRPEDVTTFNHDSKQIAFTRTPNALPLPDGAQDRFSMVMQLASLVRGDPDTYKPGVTREFFVADNDSGETWPITTIGDESVGTDHGYVSARHFMRLPRHDGDRRRIDVWLAPSLGWLPVRLVQTEPNGTQFELVWRGPLVVPGASGAPSDAAATQAQPSVQSPDQGAGANGAADANDTSGARTPVDTTAPPNGVTGGAGASTAPATSTTAPAAPSTAPGTSTTAPAAPSTAPGTSTTAPAVPSATPGTSPTAPGTLQPAPAGPQPAPAVSPAAPAAPQPVSPPASGIPSPPAAAAPAQPPADAAVPAPANAEPAAPPGPTMKP